jgi:hypothetical protein
MEKTLLCKILDDNLNSINRNTRDALAELFKNDLFIPIYDISIREMKELALKRLQKIASSKIVSVRDFLENPENIFTTHEMVSEFLTYS